MTCAHELFHADSRAILALHHHTNPLGRRELSVLLCTVLMRAASLEWYEMGDTWHQVTAERPLPLISRRTDSRAWPRTCASSCVPTPPRTDPCSAPPTP